ncbi:MAG TPA: GGDEF domain-containing protein [Acidobacteriaceae bacterium]|jgi:diguanylate cyclase (GGDEF)-like protein|nr:GGDEF domain-containing protein [Acidobacteriaceae bacterium]
MLTYAIGFVLDAELVCFAVILACMAWQDRANRSLRWLALGYFSGFCGAMIDLAGSRAPHWASMGLAMEAPVIGYGCFCVGVAVFLRRATVVRWIPAMLAAGALPLFLYWGISAGHMSDSATLQDGLLALVTMLAAFLLLIDADAETRWPRITMGAFLLVYASVEIARVGIFLLTQRMPNQVSPLVENMSGLVYVVACAALPLTFIWMMNARLVEHLNRLTLLDPLTELLNRRGMAAAAEKEVARYARSGRDLAAVVLDLDHFKHLNDQFGQDGGDVVLCGVSVLLRETLRETDVIGRLGGEEFVLLLPDQSAEGAAATVERIRIRLVEQTFFIGMRQTKVTASFGIAVSAGRDSLTWERMRHEADLALYAAKHAGRNTCRFYSDLQRLQPLEQADPNPRRGPELIASR